MSWWLSRRSKSGEPELWAIDLDPMLGMLLLGLPVVFLVFNGLLSGALMVLGFVCLLVSKVSLFRRGIWVSWGPRLMSARSGTIYRAGYLLMGVGALSRVVFRV